MSNPVATTTADLATTTTPASAPQQSTPRRSGTGTTEAAPAGATLPDPTATRPMQQPGICRTVILHMTEQQLALIEHNNHGALESPAVITHVFDAPDEVAAGVVSLKVQANGPQTPWIERVSYGDRPGQWRWPEQRDQGPRRKQHAAERMTSDPQRMSQSDLQAAKIAEQERAVPTDPQGNLIPPRLAPVSPNGQMDPRAPAIQEAVRTHRDAEPTASSSK